MTKIEWSRNVHGNELIAFIKIQSPLDELKREEFQLTIWFDIDNEQQDKKWILTAYYADHSGRANHSSRYREEESRHKTIDEASERAHQWVENKDKYAKEMERARIRAQQERDIQFAEVRHEINQFLKKHNEVESKPAS